MLGSWPFTITYIDLSLISMLQIFINRWKNPKPTSFESIVSLKEAGLILSSNEHLEPTNNHEEDGSTYPPNIQIETESQTPMLDEPEAVLEQKSPMFTLKDVASLFPTKPNNESDSESSSNSEEHNNENRRNYYTYDELPKPPPSNAEEIVQSWPSKIISESKKRVVVYMTSFPLSNSVFEACKTVRSILMRLGVMVEELDMLMDSSFNNELQRIMQVDRLLLPRVFIGGRYVGGVNKVMRMNESGQLKKFVEGLPDREPGVCEDCGGFKFVLCNSTEFRTCTTCNENELKSVLGSSETKLRICFKAKNKEYRNVYLIYSVEGSWLANQRSNPPTLNRDAVIFGHESMGCGVYDSKIVIAGKGTCDDYSLIDAFITYDMRNDVVSYEPLLPLCPSFLKSSVKPLPLPA